MTRFLFLAIAVSLTGALQTHAGEIEIACLASKRAGADRSLCGCIQDAADMTLSRSDQRLAARFFDDPNRAQEIRQSDRRKHEVFWERYKNFGATAETFCRS